MVDNLKERSLASSVYVSINSKAFDKVYDRDLKRSNKTILQQMVNVTGSTQGKRERNTLNWISDTKTCVF
jgi:hypothetical protein